MSKKNYVDYVYGETTALLGNIEKKDQWLSKNRSFYNECSSPFG